MRIFGRKFSNWWLLPLIACCPFLLIGFFAANNLAHAIFGPPTIWQRTAHDPPLGEIAGRYTETSRSSSQQSTKASLNLSADGTMSVESLPVDDFTSSCILSGSGVWELEDQSLVLHVRTHSASDSCQKDEDNAGLLYLTRQTPPYRLYWVLGDPDSGDGIWLDRN